MVVYKDKINSLYVLIRIGYAAIYAQAYGNY